MLEIVLLREERPDQRGILFRQRGKDHLALDALDELDQRDDVPLQRFAIHRWRERGLALTSEELEQHLVFLAQQDGCAVILARLPCPFDR